MADILVADDDHQVRGLVRFILEAQGHRVTVVADGVQAVAAARSGAFDLLLCDVFMPGLDGIQTLRQLSEELPRLPVVSMSGGGFGGRVSLLHVATLLGAVGVLHKPFTSEELLEVVGKALAP